MIDFDVMCVPERHAPCAGRHPDVVARKVAAGGAWLHVTPKDAAGDTKVARQTVQVPKAA
jgi:hypothetical protein